MADADAPVPCSRGHEDAARLLSVFAVGTQASGGSNMAPTEPCGGECACFPN